MEGWIGPVVFAMALPPLHGQSVSTVREVEFRSRWSNYHVDQPQVERATAARTETGDAVPEHGIVPALRSWFRTGPVILRGSLTSGWEFSNERFRTTQLRDPSTSSFYVAPAIAASYDRDLGPWTVSFRYSAGYLRYLDDNYSASGSGGGSGSGGLSQTAGFDLARQGTRLALRSSTSASSGSGYDVERARQTDRTSFAELLFAEYSLTEFLHAGATFSAGREIYSDAGSGSDETRDRWAGSLYGEYVLTGKTALRLEFGTGRESQLSGVQTALERSYYQGLLRVTYRPTGKLILTPALGFGLLDETGSGSQTPEGFRAVYSLAADYAPTEKTSVRLYLGVEGTAAQPEFSLAVNWHPRENTLVNLSIYQQSGLSTVAFAQNRTRRGALASIQQRLFQKLSAGLSAGWEQEETDDSNSQGAAVSQDPYYLLAANLAWEINSWLIWQAQSTITSRRSFSSEAGNSAQTRASVSFRLTF